MARRLPVASTLLLTCLAVGGWTAPIEAQQTAEKTGAMAQGERDATLASAALVASPESKETKSEEGKGEAGEAQEEKGEEG